MENINQNTFQQISFLEATIKVYSVNKPCVDVELVKKHLSEIYNNTSKYMGNPLKGIIIEFWDKDRSDLPKNIYDSKGNCIQLGIGNEAGLTWSSLKLIQIMSTFCQNSNDLANVLSHEIGHWLDYFTDPDLNDPLQAIWNNLRSKDSTPNTSPVELMAEDFRLLFGSTGARNIPRADIYHYKQANEIKGLPDFYLIWKKAKDYFNMLAANNITYSAIDLMYSDFDTNYISLNFTICKNGLLIPIRIDRKGVQQKVSFLFFSFYMLIKPF